MKKTITFIALIFALAMTSFGQSGMVIKGDPPPYSPTREFEATCSDITFYGQEPDIVNGYNSSSIGGWRQYDIPLITGPVTVGKVSFWGADYTVYPTRTFEVAFYADNSGVPGTLLGSNTGTLTGTLSGLLIFGQYPSLKWTMMINPPITISPGDWISVYCTDNISGWYWETSPDGDGMAWESYYGSPVQVAAHDVSYCLEPAAVPVSNWAIAIGLLLIGTFLVIRYRRMG